MTAGLFKGAIPEAFFTGLAGRDAAPLSAEMLIKFQYIALIPTRATNFRYHLYKDGRLFLARNSAEENNPIYNTPLPLEPQRILPADELGAIRAALKAEQFFQQPPFWEVRARGGALMIISARRGRQVHEVWYVNTCTPLTDLLFSLAVEPPAAQSAEDQQAALEMILADQKRELAKLQQELGVSEEREDPPAEHP